MNQQQPTSRWRRPWRRNVDRAAVETSLDLDEATAGRDISTHVDNSRTESTVNYWYSTGSPPPAPAEAVPGAVVVGAVPRPARHFIDRAQVGQLREALTREQVAVVVCESGAGKTQVAAAYAREAMHDESAVLVGWIGAETRDRTLAGLTEIAAKLGVADQEGDSLVSAHRLRDHLNSERTLSGVLVFDNATDPDFLSQFLPAVGGVRVVITSTDRAFTGLGELVDAATGFTRAESIDYLKAATGFDDPTGADLLAAEVRDLPLALAAAAATITAQGLDYSQYMKLRAGQSLPTAMPRERGNGNNRAVDQSLGLVADTVTGEGAVDERGRWLAAPSTQDYLVRWRHPHLGILEFTDEHTALTYIREFGGPDGKS
ncbi:hypothetical protein [Nocardia sp. NPDC003726]